MTSLAPIPKKGDICWFYAGDSVNKKSEYEGKVVNIIPLQKAGYIMIYKYDDYIEDVICYPLMDIWIDQVEDWFWIFDKSTDFILELSIPGACQCSIYAARDLDGGWHTFETIVPRQFGILDVTGELHKQVQESKALIVTKK